VQDYCTPGEMCIVGNTRCVASPACQQPYTPPTPPYIKHYQKKCYLNDLYWFDSEGNRQEKAQECDDQNDCTLDSCINNRCVNELKCDGSTCPIGSEAYCESCQTCGDGICNCQEDICSCPEDCQIQNLSLSILGKEEGISGQWKEKISTQPGKKLDILVILANNSPQTLKDVQLKILLPSQLEYQDNLQVNGSPIIGDLTQGIIIQSLSPGDIKTITFQAQVKKQISIQDVDVIVEASTKDFKQTDNLEINIQGQATAQISTSLIAALGLNELIKKWILWLLFGLALLGLAFLGFYYLLFWLIRKRREKQEQKQLELISH